ncbi:MAG TPA: flagellar basal body rod protein FlgC [Candidatus Omnitrophota bacterium]|nr:flagellar basal body rod protein FlgC [Candidatus Omnitrophota bacterium]
MGLDNALAISVSGVTAERTHMELISSNIANINTTRSLSGGPYRRKEAVFGEKPISFDHELATAENKLNGGVEVKDIVEDKTAFNKVYNPTHPDADSQGFVKMPNVDMSKEMVDMVYASKLYEADITVYNATKKMMTDTLQIQ